MVKISVASVLLVTALQQLVEYCHTVNLRHIHLSLDGTIDKKYDKIEDDMEKITYKNVVSMLNHENDDFRLYISANFVLKPSEDNPEEDELVWGDMKKNAKDLASTVSGMFKKTAVVIVVFPEITESFYGLEFLTTFEKEIQKSHKDISIGRGKVHFYLFLDEEEKSNIESFKNELREHNKLISIAANKDLNFYNFCSEKWSNGVESVSQVLIHEADTVEIRLKATCAKNNIGLTVGQLNPESLAGKLVKVVKAEGQTHPHQTLRIKLPNDCKEHLDQVNQFTDELIKILRNQHFDVYGKEPSAVLHIASKKQPNDEDFPVNAWRKMKAEEDGNTRSYLAVFDQSKGTVDSIKDIKNGMVKNTDLSDIKSLSIQVHCHGNLLRNGFTVCGSKAETLATEIKKIVPKKIDQVQIIFYVCEVGTTSGQKFVKKLLENLANINVQEVIHFKSFVMQQASRHLVFVIKNEKYRNKVITQMTLEADPEAFGAKDVDFPFARFTTKHKKIDNDFKGYLVLAKTEYDLIYSAQNTILS